MTPRRRLANPLLAVVIALGLGACELNPPDPTSTPQTSTTTPVASQEGFGTPSATPHTSAPPVVFRPSPGPARSRWERIQPEEPLPAHRAYRLAGDELWGLVRDDGVEMFFGGGPFLFTTPEIETTLLLGTSAEHEPNGETVTVDLATGDVTQVLPFGVRSAAWQASGVIRFVLDHPVRRDGETLLLPGVWLLDLARFSLTPVVETTGTFRFPLPERLPDATYHPGATAVLVRPQGLADRFSVVLVDETVGSERVMDDFVQRDSWSLAPDAAWLGYVTAQNELRVMDLRTGEVRPLGVSVPRGRPMWSPDSRYLADAYQWYEGYQAVVFDVLSAFSVPLGSTASRIGPIEGGWPLEWHPSEPRLLMFGDFCLPNGTWLDLLDASTGELRRLDPGVAGAWAARWSPDGTMIAVAAPELPIRLIDATGSVIPTPALERIEDLQVFAWMAGGEWLVLGDMPGSGRCY